MFFVAENANGGWAHITIGRSQSSEAHATHVHHSATLSRSTSRAVYTIFDVVDQSVFHSSYVTDIASWHCATQSGTRSGDDTESDTGGSAACARTHARYDRAANNRTEEEEVRQRGMAREKTNTNTSCIIGRIAVYIRII